MAHYAQRFAGWKKEEAYNEIIDVLEKDAPESMPVDLKDIRIHLADRAVKIGNQSLPLGERAKSNLYKQLGLGKIDTIVKPERLALIQDDLDEYMKSSKKSLVLKVKGSSTRRVEGVVSDEYKEIPHTDVIRIVQDLGATPIRIYTNDYLMRMQAIFDEKEFVPNDDEPIKLGIQVHSSEMGAAALKFDVFTYRMICGNGCIFGKKTVGSIRTIHVTNIKQAEMDAKKEIEHVLNLANNQLRTMVNKLIKAKFDQDAVIDFLGRQKLGTKALALLAERIHTNRTMFDTWNALTEAGHDSAFSDTVQETLEKAAGELLHLVAA